MLSFRTLLPLVAIAVMLVSGSPVFEGKRSPSVLGDLEEALLDTEPREIEREIGVSAALHPRLFEGLSATQYRKRGLAESLRLLDVPLGSDTGVTKRETLALRWKSEPEEDEDEGDEDDFGGADPRRR